MRDANVRRQLDRKLAELEAASHIGEVSEVLRVRGPRRHYRIRSGDYRLGVFVEGDVVTLMRFRHRQGFYDGFP